MFVSNWYIAPSGVIFCSCYNYLVVSLELSAIAGYIRPINLENPFEINIMYELLLDDGQYISELEDVGGEDVLEEWYWNIIILHCWSSNKW